MHAPTATIIRSADAPRCSMLRIVAGTMPCATPRQPACTAATRLARGSVSSTGAQSATRTESACPGSALTNASPSAKGGSARGTPASRSACRMPTPCTCRTRISDRSCNPTAAMKRRQFSCTRSHVSGSPGASASPRFSESKGAGLTPPTRVLKPCGMPAACSRLDRRHVTPLSATMVSKAMVAAPTQSPRRDFFASNSAISRLFCVFSGLPARIASISSRVRRSASNS